MRNSHPLEVVARVSETQLQVGENLNTKTQREKDQLKDILVFFCDSIYIRRQDINLSYQNNLKQIKTTPLVNTNNGRYLDK